MSRAAAVDVMVASVRGACACTATAGLLLELGKARLSALVLVTAAVGFVLAGGPQVDWPGLGWTVAGTGLTALGANALNQWAEAERDGRMRRTCGRPLPSRRLSRPAALAFGLLAGAGGPVLLASRVGGLAAGLALATLLIYVLLYTPLKVRSALNTLVGAVVGALPPLVGWAGGAGRLEPGGWILAGMLFFWQVPHFLALAWLYRGDYARGGFRMLPVVDRAGHLTGCVVVVYTLVLIGVAFLPVVVGLAGWAYGAGGLVLGAGFLAAGLALERRPTAAAARRVFVASLVYLPLVMGLLVVDRRVAEPAAAGSAALEPGGVAGRVLGPELLDVRPVGLGVHQRQADEEHHEEQGAEQDDRVERPVVAQVHEV